MMKTLKWWAVGVALALAAVAASGTVVLARDDDDDDNPALAAQLVQRGEILSLEQILQSLPPEHRGKMLKSELDHERNRYVYEVEIRDDRGIVWEMEFDAKTGELLRAKQDD
jgi:uncharacterized membrane protein YkoI